MNNLHPFILRLRVARVRARRSQHDIAYTIGVHPNSVQAWERGENKPSLHMFEAWANTLGLYLHLTPRTPDADHQD